MSMGELAKMINGESWLASGIVADLTVIPYEGKINQKVKEEAFNPPPSPNMSNFETAWLYQGLCLLEGTNISEGRGTDSPFKLIGVPWLDNQKLFDQLVKNKHPLDDFELAEFTPQSIPAAKYPKYKNENCFGLRIHHLENPLEWTIQLLTIIKSIYPEEFKFMESNFIDKLYGSDRLRLSIENNKNIDLIINHFNKYEDNFNEIRSKYLIY